MRQADALFSDCTFLKSAAAFDQLPHDNKPEIAFAGRSNVGKSSLINKLTGQRHLAKTSNTPGRTQLLNYFTLADKAYLVDMPGYGYAKAPKEKVAEWTRLIEVYLRERRNLKRVFLLIDARHGIKDGDEQTMKFLESFAISYQPVLTKLDKLKLGEQATAKAMLEESLKKQVGAYPQLIATSAETGEGIEILRSAVFQALGV
jgi:GTP-binding protein